MEQNVVPIRNVLNNSFSTSFLCLRERKLTFFSVYHGTREDHVSLTTNKSLEHKPSLWQVANNMLKTSCVIFFHKQGGSPVREPGLDSHSDFPDSRSSLLVVRPVANARSCQGGTVASVSSAMTWAFVSLRYCIFSYVNIESSAPEVTGSELREAELVTEGGREINIKRKAVWGQINGEKQRKWVWD